ncbi:2Fe-2S iron-sulfur cluster-binding protein [Streptomyces sp. PR69]|uniref:2Fe-2S iron-sulfur cluster-binding protein n=1 Tax=Streptomyces sp. PR69 TaxID=2984950 RepID=UPI002264919C|nr:2Fe-2S iron-sulfur cluster-binding protein [Streptomyces sp. PR69]
MSTDESERQGQGRAAAQGEGGWQPTSQGGEYDADATAFFQLPADDHSQGGALDAAAPLEAPGHGYVPPMITPLTPAADFDPAATASWAAPQPTGQWDLAEAAGAPEGEPPTAADAPASSPSPSSSSPLSPAASELTGQWTIPVANGDLPDESGEYSTSVFASQWGGAPPPATLPGGAPAPWSTAPSEASPRVPAQDRPATLPGGAPAPWADALSEAGAPAVVPPDEPSPAAEEPAAHEDAVPAPEACAPEAPEAAAAVPEPVPEPEASAPMPDESAVSQSPQPQPQPEPEPDSTHASPPTPEPGPEPGPESAPEPAPPSTPPSDEHPSTSYVLRVNGADRPVTDAWIGESLLYVLRERLGLAGAKDGCSQGECGACNVQVDGRLVASCLVPAATAAGSEVRTVEGLATDGEPSDVQRALAKCGAVQCGYCIPGMAMTVHDLLEGNHAPTDLETRRALCGNLCRCSGYQGVLAAVREVVAERAASAAAAAEADAEREDGSGHGSGHGRGPAVAEPRIPHQAPPGAGSVHPHPHDGGMA